jgi:hypothetical protein
MSHVLKVELSDAAYAGLERRARDAATSAAELAAAALELQFRDAYGPPQVRPTAEPGPGGAR